VVDLGRERAGAVRGFFLTVGVLAAVIAGIVYFNFGTLSPCGVLREKVRHSDALAAMLPDGLIDLAITAQFGALSPGRCIELLFNNQIAQPTAQPPQPVARPPAPPAPATPRRSMPRRTAAHSGRRHAHAEWPRSMSG
jgi:hypothetical protein